MQVIGKNNYFCFDLNGVRPIFLAKFIFKFLSSRVSKWNGDWTQSNVSNRIDKSLSALSSAIISSLS